MHPPHKFAMPRTLRKSQTPQGDFKLSNAQQAGQTSPAKYSSSISSSAPHGFERACLEAQQKFDS